MPPVLASAAFVSTGVGGIAALRLRSGLHLLFGFCAGAVIAVALFEMFPEVLKLNGGSPMRLAAVGFLAFFALERYAVMCCREPDGNSRGQTLGILSAGGLCVHSLLDGVAIGAGFQSSAKLGLLIAIGIITHDLSDGLNTVTVVVAHGNSRRLARLWLLIDMIAPVVGAASTLFLTLDGSLPWVLAFFGGSFLYIGASDLLPQARAHDSSAVCLATAIGMLMIFITTGSLTIFRNRAPGRPAESDPG